MNETLQLLKSRTSVRRFQDKPISPENRELIINAALQAPSAGNQILYTILDIQDQKIKDTLAVTCDDQSFIAQAPMVFIFLADCRRWVDCYEYAGAEPRTPGPGDLLIACADALIAAQNTVIAAQSLGIGSCYIGDIIENYEEHVELLHLDPFIFPAAMLIYGYPGEDQKNLKKPKRFDQKFIVQKDTYSRLPEEDLRDMFKAVHAEKSFNFDEYLKTFCSRKYMSDFALEMSRSAGKYLEHFGVLATPARH